ncbi:uncharacterized protein MEPE_06274 [Melanopsichium pennsylvanicum]|uniref:INO80 complex subunit F domain-containing protein n=2 Tax=Melanopsichium pennsylvanicum TaxID=63383 RepID=A0AAJ4XQX3_9BASI|nr:uncharacterized protein BN887_04409 [Melanopsichium pennsylvanicum 4]SNX87564.1 uncharacterized protein MEPE_06274 [Melanopsichium pennsylvanicum]
MSATTPATQPVKTKSKAYSSTVAIQGDAAKYRLKYKELKRKVREIEVENDKLHLKTLGIKRNIQRMRLERAILYERLEAESQATPSIAAYPPPPPLLAAPTAQTTLTHHYDHEHPYTSNVGVASSSAAPRGGAADYDRKAYVASPSGSGVYRQPETRQSMTAEPRSRASYGAYDDYPPPPPPPSAAAITTTAAPVATSGPRTHQPHSHSRSYVPPISVYDSRHDSPKPPPPTSSVGDQAERLRQYTESASPEPPSATSLRRDVAHTPPLSRSVDPTAGVDAPGLVVSSNTNNTSSRGAGMKVTLRRAP